MTSQPSPLKGDQLTLFAVDSPAKTSAPQASKPASMKAQGRVSFTNSCESFAWFSQDSSSWKTSQRSLLTDWTPFLGSWPRQGLMRNGHVFQQVLWEPAISAIDGGSLPTPTTSDHCDRTYHYPACVGVTRGEKLSWAIGKHLGHNDGLTGQPGVNRSRPTGAAMYLNPAFLEEMMGYPIGWTELKL